MVRDINSNRDESGDFYGTILCSLLPGEFCRSEMLMLIVLSFVLLL